MSLVPKNIYMRMSKSQKAAVKRNITKVRGSGAYIFDKKSNPFGHYGEKIGKYLSPYLGAFAPLGRKLGAYGGHLIGKAFGSGAYNLSSKYKPKYRSKYPGIHKMIKGSGAYDIPSCGEVLTNSNSPPSFGGNRSIVRHREFIGDVLSSTSFTLTQYNVNPGDESTFPWLAGIAVNYQKYRPIGCIFEFKSTSANALNSTNTALGTVSMAVNYNSIDANEPTSKMQMLQLENCVSACPAESALCGIECARQYNPLDTLYVRNGLAFEVPNGAEQFYDFASFYIATEGMQAANVTIGELWVTYEMELLTPQLNAGQVGNEINHAHYRLGSGVSTSAYFSGASNALELTNMNLTFGTATVTFPSSISTGCYCIIYYIRGSNGADVIAPGISYTTNCVALDIVVGDTLPYCTANTTGGNQEPNMLFVHYIQITGPSAVFTYSGATFPASISGGDFYALQLPNSLAL